MKKILLIIYQFYKKIKFINQETNFNGNFDNFLSINFDKTFKVIKL